MPDDPRLLERTARNIDERAFARTALANMYDLLRIAVETQSWDRVIDAREIAHDAAWRLAKVQDDGIAAD